MHERKYTNTQLRIKEEGFKYGLFKSSEKQGPAGSLPSFHEVNKMSSSLKATVSLLLKYTVEGNQNLAQELVEKGPDVIVIKGPVYDEMAEIMWENISPLEYAAWSGDKHMLGLYISKLPQESRKTALGQLENVKDHGIEHRKHLSKISSLIKAYEHYIEVSKITKVSQLGDVWTKVGFAQRKAPVNFLQFFCSPCTLEHFDEKPSRICSVYNGNSELIGPYSKLGKTFTLYKRGPWCGATLSAAMSYGPWAGPGDYLYPPGGDRVQERDLKLVREFYKSRKKDLEEKIIALQNELAPSFRWPWW